MTNNNK